MAQPEKQFSRIRATFAGAITGVTIAGSAGLFLVATSANGSAYYAKNGLTPLAMIIIALPGVLTIGSIVAFPTSAAMVFLTTAASSRVRIFDNAAAWIASGTLFAIPTAYLFSTLQPGRDEFAVVSVWAFFLIVGGISGLTAWILGHTNDR